MWAGVLWWVGCGGDAVWCGRVELYSDRDGVVW